jgi:hypothetical protein
MNFMLLILEPHGQRAARTDAEGRDAYRQMLDYAAVLDARGQLVAAQSLAGDVDGPFAESKEMIGGYFIVDVPARADAVAIAAEIPAARWATVEVREFGPCFERGKGT